jgi:hypothetical protein
MKKFFKIAAFTLLLFTAYKLGYWGLKKALTKDTDQILSTEHFTIYYRQVSDWDAKNVATNLEENYDRIIGDLHAPSHPKMHVYIHPNKEQFIKAAGFYAQGIIKGIDTLHLLDVSFPHNWIMPMDEVAVHEFVHNVTLNTLIQEAISSGKIQSITAFENLYHKEGKRFDQVYPRWLWESIAVYEADQFNPILVNFTLKRDFPTLKQMNEHGNTTYILGYTLVDFIIQTYGKDKLFQLMHSDGDTKQVLGLTDQEFEQAWEKFVRKNY